MDKKCNHQFVTIPNEWRYIDPDPAHVYYDGKIYRTKCIYCGMKGPEVSGNHSFER